MELFHASIRLPDNFVAPKHRVRLTWSNHADHARKDDRYCEIPKFETLPLSAFEVFEVGIEGSRIVKLAVRGHFTKDIDVCFVLAPITRSKFKVITVWANDRNDCHGTLDASRYVR